MTENAQLPPILPPSDHERLSAPRTMLAIGIFTLFGATVILPYFQIVPSGAATNLILTTSEILKAVLLLVVGFYFGTSQSSTRKDEVIAAQVATPVVAAPGGAAADRVTLQPGGSVQVDAVAASEEDPAMFGGPRP